MDAIRLVYRSVANYAARDGSTPDQTQRSYIDCAWK